MTNPTQLRIRIAEAQGWTHCEIRNGRPRGFCPDSQAMEYIPDYPNDPREWAAMLTEMAVCPTVSSVLTETCIDEGLLVTVVNLIPNRPHAKIPPQRSTTLGLAVCLAYAAWAEARQQQGEQS